MNENPGGPGSEAGVREQARQQRRGQGIQIHVNAEEQAAINRVSSSQCGLVSLALWVWS